MTHDELLERLDELKYDVGDSGMNEEYKAIYALRAVVELHKPDTFNIHGQTVSVCPECNSEYCWSDEEGQYPCPTIQAIEKELK